MQDLRTPQERADYDLKVDVSDEAVAAQRNYVDTHGSRLVADTRSAPERWWNREVVGRYESFVHNDVINLPFQFATDPWSVSKQLIWDRPERITAGVRLDSPATFNNVVSATMAVFPYAYSAAPAFIKPATSGLRPVTVTKAELADVAKQAIKDARALGIKGLRGKAKERVISKAMPKLYAPETPPYMSPEYSLDRVVSPWPGTRADTILSATASPLRYLASTIFPDAVKNASRGSLMAFNLGATALEGYAGYSLWRGNIAAAEASIDREAKNSGTKTSPGDGDAYLEHQKTNQVTAVEKPVQTPEQIAELSLNNAVAQLTGGDTRGFLDTLQTVKAHHPELVAARRAAFRDKRFRDVFGLDYSSAAEYAKTSASIRKNLEAFDKMENELTDEQAFNPNWRH